MTLEFRDGFVQVGYRVFIGTGVYAQRRRPESRAGTEDAILATGIVYAVSGLLLTPRFLARAT